MISFDAIIEKFEKKGEKTGWTYIPISATLAHQLKPDTKTSFRVKGTFDSFKIKQTALLPMGDGDFIIPFNNEHRRGTKKKEGDKISLTLETDDSPLEQSAELLACLEDEPKALVFFEKLPKSHQLYYSKWVESAKTIETKTKRIVMCVHGMAMDMDYGQMMRYYRDKQ